MDALVEKLDTKLRSWRPEPAAQVRKLVAELIDLADTDALDLMRSRTVEQEVLDILDEPSAR
jgi:RPA family protein